ncbi:hypothetical protein AAMO2058_000712500 [Amorphochlora amoebiformis]
MPRRQRPQRTAWATGGLFGVVILSLWVIETTAPASQASRTSSGLTPSRRSNKPKKTPLQAPKSSKTQSSIDTSDKIENSAKKARIGAVRVADSDERDEEPQSSPLDKGDGVRKRKSVSPRAPSRGRGRGARRGGIRPGRPRGVSVKRLEAGAIYTFGTGDYGELGFPARDLQVLTPKKLPFPGNISVHQAATSGLFTVALATDGQVYTWGVNDGGALGRPAGHICKMKSGLKGPYGSERVPEPVNIPTTERIVQISAGDGHAAALDEIGNVYMWGTFQNDEGVFGIDPDTKISWLPKKVTIKMRDYQDRIVRLASGAHHIVALSRRGAMYTWGSGDQGQLGRPVKSMVERHCRAASLTPRLIPQRGLGSIFEVGCGAYTTFAISRRGVFVWGLNNYGQLGIPLPQNASGIQFVFKPTRSEALSALNITSIAGSIHHTLALSNGKLYSFGRGTYGRLGRSDVNHKTDDAKPDPRPVEKLEGVNITSFSAGMAISGATGSEPGQVYMWGMGTTSQLGKDDLFPDDEHYPSIVEFKENTTLRAAIPRSISIGGAHVVVLDRIDPPANTINTRNTRNTLDIETRETADSGHCDSCAGS